LICKYNFIKALQQQNIFTSLENFDSKDLKKHSVFLTAKT